MKYLKISNSTKNKTLILFVNLLNEKIIYEIMNIKEKIFC